MLVKTHHPALIPAIKRAGHEPVLVEPLIYDSPCEMGAVDDRLVLVLNPDAPVVVAGPGGPRTLEFDSE